MKKKVIVLGAGLVGKAMAIDLSSKYDVTSCDVSQESLDFLQQKYRIKTKKVDLSVCENIEGAVKDADLVINAMPGFMGFKTLKHIIIAQKNVVDISFFPEDPFELDELARSKNVTAIMDAGVAPGMGNIICGYHNKHMQVSVYKCYVGGLPKVRELPFEYKAPFSPVDVIQEYIRPARFVENGKLIIKEPLTDREYLNFDNVGTLEAFNTDGIRTLYKTMDIPNIIEKTMRYPRTMDYIQMLKDTGFFSEEEVEINGVKIKPLDLTSKLLVDKWKLNEHEKDITVMRVIIEGTENNKPKKYIYNLFDEYHQETETISMARTTGYTCTAIANLVLEDKFTKKGLIAPEIVGENKENFNFILNYLKDRDVIYTIEKS